MAPKSTTSEFIQKAERVHGDRFDYSLVSYINNTTKVLIRCRKHGEFLQNPSSHLSGRIGCTECVKEKTSESRSSNTEEFIKKSKAIHGDKYDYSKVQYVKNYMKVTIICKRHGEFQQTPQTHLGHGCPSCKKTKLSEDRAFTTDDFIERAEIVHRQKYFYHLVDYVNAHTKVTIECPYHGYFDQVPMNHLKGHGCDKCAHNKLRAIYQIGRAHV